MSGKITNFGTRHAGDIAKQAMKDFRLTEKMLQRDDPTIVVEGNLQDWLRGNLEAPEDETKDGVTTSQPLVGDGVFAACAAIAATYKVPPPRVMGYMLREIVLRQAKELSKKHKIKYRVGPRFHFYPRADTRARRG